MSTTAVTRTRVTAGAFAALGVLLFAGAAAFASGTLHTSAATGLTQGEIVNVTGTGLSPNVFGYVLECNNTPGEPTVPVGPPFDERIPVGCSPPSLKHIVSTASDGTLSTTFAVHLSRRLGPPCNPLSVFGGCGPSDSAHKRPRADAQNYPCPPSPAQQTAKVTCSLVFYDSAREKVSTPIRFVGGGPTMKPPPTTPPPTTVTTTPGSPPTTKPKSPSTSPGNGKKPPTTTIPPTGVTTTPRPPRTTVTTSAPRGGISPGTTTPGSGTVPADGVGGGGDPALTTSKVVPASSGSLAFTGLGAMGQVLALVGLSLVVLGIFLFFANVRRVAQWFLGR